jgi:hypothetical protein
MPAGIYNIRVAPTLLRTCEDVAAQLVDDGWVRTAHISSLARTARRQQELADTLTTHVGKRASAHTVGLGCDVRVRGYQSLARVAEETRRILLKITRADRRLSVLPEPERGVLHLEPLWETSPYYQRVLAEQIERLVAGGHLPGDAARDRIPDLSLFADARH